MTYHDDDVRLKFNVTTDYRSKKLTQVYSRYPCEKLLMERVFVRTG